MSLPEWLREKLVEAGTMTASGLTRSARIGHCANCGLCILGGLDADVAALPALCDPTPLTATGEVVALLAERRTYTLIAGKRLELHPRESWHIAGQRRLGDVLAEHACGQSLAAFAAPSIIRRTTTALPPRGAPCPF